MEKKKKKQLQTTKNNDISYTTTLTQRKPKIKFLNISLFLCSQLQGIMQSIEIVENKMKWKTVRLKDFVGIVAVLGWMRRNWNKVWIFKHNYTQTKQKQTNILWIYSKKKGKKKKQSEIVIWHVFSTLFSFVSLLLSLCYPFFYFFCLFL